MYIRSLGISCLLLGLLFKVLHWPGGSVLLILGGGVSLCTTLILLARGSSTVRLPVLLYPSAIVAWNGVIFKLMHWPGANIQLLLGLLGCALWFAIPPRRLHMPAQVMRSLYSFTKRATWSPMRTRYMPLGMVLTSNTPSRSASGA